jgi:ankyrin repeat protein
MRKITIEVVLVAVLTLVLAGCNGQLFRAAKEGKLAGAKDALEAGADVNARENSWTPLFLAAYNGQAEMTTLLIKAGADVNARDDKGETPLYFAAQEGHAEVAALLIDKYSATRPNIWFEVGWVGNAR